MNAIKLSLLELAAVCRGGSHRDAIARSVAAAQQAERLNYARVWLAEHHNMPHIASSATAILISHLASNTKTIRVGSGGIMLPNHAPLVVAEQFGTLETLYPGRIDLGLGRAPGTDQVTAMALRRNNLNTAFYFKDDIQALQQFFDAENEGAKVRAFPGEGLAIPLYILGSSTDSAYLAAELGLPYAFAAHFAPAQLRQAVDIYRQHFKPSEHLMEPYLIVCVNVIAGADHQEAQTLATSLYNLFAGIITNQRFPLSPPTEKPIYEGIAEIEKAVNNMVSCTFTGDRRTLQEPLMDFIQEYQVDELMTTNYIFDASKRLASFEILKDVIDDINQRIA